MPCACARVCEFVLFLHLHCENEETEKKSGRNKK